MDNNQNIESTGQDQPKPTPKYWMSLDQWRQDPEFIAFAEKEFRTSPLQSTDGEGGWARREFLKLMGASLALTTFGCVRRPAQKIVPYVKKPAEIQHGFPNYYASSFVDGFEALGIVVTTRDGRPIKIEGNPDHPANAGGMSSRAHATILKLYDPDRFTGPKHNLQNKKRTNRETINSKWEDLDKAVSAQLAKGQVALLTANTMSPTTNALMEDFASAFGAKIYQYSDVGYESVVEAQKASYGSANIPRYRMDRAKVIVSINNDFLGTWLTPTVFGREFAMGRKKQDMNKLIVFESIMSLTGSNADRRFRIRPSQSLDVVMAILNELIAVKKVSRYSGDANVVKALSGFSKTELPFNVGEVAAELWNARGASLVLAGDTHGDTEDALALNVAVNFLNSVLENDGKTIEAGGLYNAKGLAGGISELMASLKANGVKTLIIHGSNPAYSMPQAAQFAQALAGCEMVISTADRNDETARLADYVAVDHHSLENWGDVQSHAGILSLQQPTIQPLYNTRAFQDSMIAWMKGANKGPARAKVESWYNYLQNAWKGGLAKPGGKSFDDYWSDLLQKGVQESSVSSAGRSFASSSLSNVKPAQRKTGFELALYTTVGVGDGSMANVPWLQELPDPITKVCWDNYASFSIADSKQLKIKDGATVTLTVGDQKVTVPAHIQPGQADGVIALALGYGRNGAGRVADGVGVNAYPLAQWVNGRRVTSGIPVSVSVNAQRYQLAITQGHHTMEGRQIVVEETLKDFIAKPGGRIHRHLGAEKLDMWSGHQYTGNKWGMVIDLNTCNGCGACVTACQSENNIPTVGRKYVIDGREMHWLRIDRYWVGNPEDPDTVHQPLPCMHCENAPCETVCPVIATVHSDEGTNDMIYNRCVGTRYCSNNCPYKVRRFNWFSYTDIVEPRQMALNPEVTVRSRGVMEKCTFCIHRIRNHKQMAKLEGRKLATDEFTVACAASCASGAIVFGDLNDPKAAVTKLWDQPQSYALLEELNTKPRVRYQVKVRNADALKGEDKHHGPGTEDKGHHS